MGPPAADHHAMRSLRRGVGSALLATVLAAAGLAGVGVVTADPAGAYPGAPWFRPSQPYTANFPDPSVVVDDGTYYAYSTATGGAYLPVMTSTDATSWRARPAYPQPACVEGPVDPYFNDALACPARWAADRPVDGRLTKEVWAPGVAEVDGRWVAFYAARMSLDRDRFCISVATADNPLGPFVDDSTGPLVCDADPNGSIDPQPFVDADGTAWLVWKSEGVPGAAPTRIWSRRLAPGATAFAAGSTAVELARTDQAWEGDVIENPALVRHDGRLLLFYSANRYASADYATGYAECASATGPCTKHPGNPVLSSDGARLGPGGASPFVDTTGALRLAYHSWNAPYISYPAFPACQDDATCETSGQRRMTVAWVHRGADGLHVTASATPPVPTSPKVPPRPTPPPVPTSPQAPTSPQVPVRPPVQSLVPACPLDGVPPSGFGDVTGGETHARAVDCARWWGLTGGTSPGRFSPGAPVTRGQMATFVARLLRTSGAGLPVASGGRFADVLPGSFHQQSIDDLAAVGVVTGRTDATFDPGATVTRAQMASFLVRAYERASGQSLVAARDWFPDDDRDVHAAAIDKATSAGLAGGRTDGTYGPGQTVTRGQMASFLARTLARLAEVGHVGAPPGGV